MTDAADSNDYISPAQFRGAEGTRDWPVLSNGATSFFPIGSLATAARFVQAIAELEGTEGHRPNIDIRPEGVTVRLLTTADDWWGMSRRDLDLARRISGVAAGLGLYAEPGAVQSVDPIVIGVVDIQKVMPFWQALMGYGGARTARTRTLSTRGARALGSGLSRWRAPGPGGIGCM